MVASKSGKGTIATAKGKSNVRFDHNFRVGDILVSQRDWDVAWYQVVGVTAQSIRIKQIEGSMRYTGHFAGYSTPVPKKYIGTADVPIEGVVKRVYRTSDERGLLEYIKVGSDIACRWDGFEQYVSPYGSQEVPR